MGNARGRQPLPCDLYEGLTGPERDFLSREFALTRRIPSSLAFLRAVPYPLAEETAATVAALVQRYVYPWPELRARYLLVLVRARLMGEPGVHELPLFDDRPAEEIEALFYDPEDYRQFSNRTDFTHGLAGIRDAEVEEECDSLQRILEAAAADGLFRLGLSALLPLPLGPPSLARVPLVDGQWIDRHVVELAEWWSVLFGAGYRRLPALDPHPLAWHRLYPPGTNWALPKEADRVQVDALRRQAVDRLDQYRGRVHEIDGRAHIHFEDYTAWPHRAVPGDLAAQRTRGVVVASWNAWVDTGSGNGRVDVFDDVVGKFDHPLAMRVGHDYAVTSPLTLLGAEQLRSAATAELRELAFDRTIRTNPGDILTPVQVAILVALRRKPWQTADELAGAVGYDRSRLYQRGGLNELRRMEPPLVILGSDGRRYALADVTPDVTRR